MIILSVHDLRELVKKTGEKEFRRIVREEVRATFKRRQQFSVIPRLATYVPGGVIELMPCSDDEYYSFKYVNGHPKNTKEGKLCVAAVGMLSDVATGYPLLVSEMTLLTAFRTAATAALAAEALARPDSSRLAIIGCGAQSEFQVLAMADVLPITQVKFYDIDPDAMKKFRTNLKNEQFRLIPASSAEDCVEGADVVITATAAKVQNRIITADMVENGMHLSAIGGDSPGKTELDAAILSRAKIVVEFHEQTKEEGEVQNAPDASIHAELWEVLSGIKPGRADSSEVTLFDSVGFALEDYAALRAMYALCTEHSVGSAAGLIPHVDNPKDLYRHLR